MMVKWNRCSVFGVSSRSAVSRKQRVCWSINRNISIGIPQEPVIRTLLAGQLSSTESAKVIDSAWPGMFDPSNCTGWIHQTQRTWLIL